MFLMCHKSAQIDNMSRAATDTIYVTDQNDQAFFKNFNDNYSCNHKIFWICNKYEFDLKKKTIELKDHFFSY